ncbi:hemolysin family protein [Algihabitans albus]|uniref:hemolysin family protein n=1 Tax=Algihabitans albus TaxID=2164067 RepID=UPI0035CFF26E
MSDASQTSNGRGWLKRLFKGRNGDHLRDTIEEIIGGIDEDEEEGAASIGSNERMMLANILKLRHLTAYDVMVPRADILSVEADTELDSLIETFNQAGHSRLPVYRENLDDPIGFVHIKDVLGYAKGNRRFRLANIVRPLQIVAPSMLVLDLLLEMRLRRAHMALVVDEYGGIDGLITIEDLVEQIVGEIEDEHDVLEGPKLVARTDGSLLADARMPIEDFEAEVCRLLSAEEREEDIDTLGGLVVFLAGRVPARGELIEHAHSRVTFEIVQADPRRVKRLRLRNLPPRKDEATREPAHVPKGQSATGHDTAGTSPPVQAAAAQSGSAPQRRAADSGRPAAPPANET